NSSSSLLFPSPLSRSLPFVPPQSHSVVSIMANSEWAADPGWRYLRESSEEALKNQASRLFDNTTHRWIPDAEEGFLIGEIKSEEGDSLTLLLPNGDTKNLSKNEVQEINPAKYEKTEDMSTLTFLNEASVLHNLRMRYKSMMIYTYSGLFCVFINPYKLLPIYTDSVASMYINRRRSEMPPHLFAVSDEAFRNMLHDKKNQSMLITGESGAGKTENTKKVISYFARIGGSNGDRDKQEISLEEQVVQANPAIEAFGNGATVRNYNSSRFGKFIRMHFDTKGTLVGGDIEHYLLEKSRVITQAPGERSYHIFYQIMTQKHLRDKFFLEDDVHKYSFVSQAEITVPGMDDQEEWKTTDKAFDVMNFCAEEKEDLYKLCAAIMHMGEMRFKQKPREEQAEIEDMKSATLASKLFGVEEEKLVGALLRPRVKVGVEWVCKGQNQQQVEWAVGALAKAIYARMFTWLIKRCNKTLQGNEELAVYYIGVLDIAGFEIFDRNSFEQLWINFVNEKLQQFFNHHMFVLEQEEYKREGIAWTFIDFGLDLQSCIDLIEKPLGIISMLDEECIVPKASDMTYVDKLTTQHLGKHPNFQKAKPPKGKQAQAHFAIVHYAGVVRYNAEHWLDKNKDPLNDSAVAVLKTSDKQGILYALWEEYITDVDREESAARGKQQTGGRRGKAASFLTVSTMYRESLTSLMAMLHSTQPHFIRCIIPNEKKTSGLIDAPLVLNQLTCNGVLEGIRICRKGFPNRMIYAEFKYRYAILAAQEAREKSPRKASEAMLKKLVDSDIINVDNFKTGETKVFFRAGMLARMEELRDEAISKMLLALQTRIRWFLAQKAFKRLTLGDEMAAVIQYNVRQWNKLHSWQWWRLFQRMKPMLKGMRPRAEVEMLEKRLKEVEDSQAASNEERKKLAEELSKKNNELDDVKGSLERERAAANRRKKEMEELNKSLRGEHEAKELLEWKAKETERERERERKEWEEKMNGMRMEEEKATAVSQMEKESLAKQISQLNGHIESMTAQKKAQEMANAELKDKLEQAALNEERMLEMQEKLKEDVNLAEEKALQEKKLKEDAMRAKKKVESELNKLAEQLLMLKNQQSAVDADSKRRDEDFAELKLKAIGDANLIVKLQMHIRQLIQRIEELEDELDNEMKLRLKLDRQRNETQEALDSLNEKFAETDGELVAQKHLNRERGETLSQLQKELQKKSLVSESYMADLCSMQYVTLHNLRTLSAQAKVLENDALRVLETRKSQQLYRGSTIEDDDY
ncbi:hypothetical protein PMAYCL1PPCAC_12360, partial [Pristionchus mayeri]